MAWACGKKGEIELRRYWVHEDCIKDDEVTLEGDTLHHVRDVCRQTLGNKFEVLCGDGKAYFVEIMSEEKKKSLCKVIDVRAIPPLPEPRIHLCVSLPKLSRLELIFEKSVELGVSRVTAFTSEFSFFRDLKKVNEKKMERFQKIILGATQQSGRGDVMELSPIQSLEALLSEVNNSPEVLCLLPYEGQCEKNLKQVLKTSMSPTVKEIKIFVGSEGGFSDSEVEKFKSHGVEPLTIGDQVLRVETACISLVSMLKYELWLG